MTPKTIVGALCAGIFCASGLAHAQSSGSGSATSDTGGTSATSPDSASSAGKNSTAHRGSATKGSSSDKSGGAVASPSGGIANPKDVTPGTYNQSGAAVPRTSDPMQTKSSRDGSPLPSATPRAANAASANQK